MDVQPVEGLNTVTQGLNASYSLLEQQVSALKKELTSLSQQRLEELTEKEKLAARFAALFDVLPGGIVVLDTSGHIIEHNRIAETLLQMPLAGCQWNEVLDDQFISQTSRGDVLLKSGAVVSVASTAMADSQGQIILLTDLTESHQRQSRQKQQLEQVRQPVFESPAGKRVLQMALQLARSDCTVLISGESGTGKEVIARFIHRHSSRASQPFVAINCAAIPETMLEATLFGHEKGAFTGAHQASAGKFEQANGGTLLLDEISEMTPALQAKLLRVLQEKEVERVGGKKSIVLDVRVIATSNRNLVQAIRQGDFREDLYFRLNVFPLVMPALRERSEEIPALVDYFISRHTPAGKHPPAVSIHAKAALQAYAWPGNIRELENAVQRALVLATGDILQTADFWLQDVALPMDTLLPETAMTSTAVDLVSVRKRHEYEQITAVLAETQGNRRQAAQRLGISERNLRYKLAAMRDQGYNN